MNKTFRKISLSLHLLLAKLSCMVVFVVCLTGSMYVFKDEISDFTQPWKFVVPEERPVLFPEKVLEIAHAEVSKKTPTAITYGESSDAVFVDYYDPEEGMSTVYINPYSGKVIKTVIRKKEDFDFFNFVLTGHRTLWFSAPIGKPIVGFGVLFFAITLITGIILWWPKRWNKSAFKRNFTIKRKATFARFNFALHNVLGGYAALILLVLSFTGLIWSFNWFGEKVYTITSGGEALKPYTLPKSVISDSLNELSTPLDNLFIQLKQEEPLAKTFYFALPVHDDDVFRVSIVHERGSYYKTDNLFFDRYTLKSLKGSGPYAGRYTEASSADKFRRMNLDIHDGRILGIFGKIMVFLAGLIGASLPVTGFIIWYRKKRKSVSH